MKTQQTDRRVITTPQTSTRESLKVEDIAKVRLSLLSNPRDLLLFDLLTQTGAKLKDALKLKVKDLSGLDIGARLPILIAGATKPILTKKLAETFTSYREKKRLQPEDYLFKSRKSSLPLSLTSASHLIRKWFRNADATSLRGAISLRTYYINFLKLQRGTPLGDESIKITSSDSSSLILKPVEVSTLHETVYQQLFRAILLGHIAPGTRIVAGKIAKQMKVSPMPVREALHRLQATGFLSRSKQRACIVNKLSSDNLREIIRIRLVLEPLAARYAALYRQNETIDILRKIHGDYTRAIKNRDSDKFLELNRKFHNTIYREAKMPILFELLETLWGRASPYQYILWRAGARTDVEWSIKTHSDIIDALYHKDADRVEAAVRSDLSTANDNLMKMLDHLWGKER